MCRATGKTSIVLHHFTYWVSIRAGESRLSKVTRKPLSTDRNHVSGGKVGLFKNAYVNSGKMWHYSPPTHPIHFGDDKLDQMLSQHFTPGSSARNSMAQCFQATKFLQTLCKPWTANYEANPQDMPKWLSKAAHSRNCLVRLFCAWCSYFCYYRGEIDTKPHARCMSISLPRSTWRQHHSSAFTYKESSTGRQRELLVFWHQKNCNSNSSLETLCYLICSVNFHL